MNSHSRAVSRPGVARYAFVTSLLASTLMILSTTVLADAPVPGSSADQERILKELEDIEKKDQAREEPAPTRPAPSSPARSPWYIGANAGRTDYDLSESDFDAAFAAAGFTSSTDIDDKDTGYKVFAGWQFHKSFAVELGYVDLGDFDIATNITAPTAATFNGDAEVDGFSLSLVGTLPVSDRFSLLGRVGAYSWDVDSQGSVTIGATTVNLDGDDSGTDVNFGVGAQYDFNNNFGARAEYEVYTDVGDEDDIDFLSAGVVFRF